MTEQLKIHDAVRLAMLRKIHRLAAIRDELDALGYLPFIQPHELYLLESEGYLLDFTAGTCVDTLAGTTATLAGTTATLTGATVTVDGTAATVDSESVTVETPERAS